MLKTTPCWCLSDYCNRVPAVAIAGRPYECAGCSGPCVMDGVAARLVTDIERVIGVLKTIENENNKFAL